MEELIKQIGRPFAVIGIAIILGSLATGFNIFGFSIDPDKWIAGLVVGFVFIGISFARNWGK